MDRILRKIGTLVGGAVVAYAVVVLWCAATSPDLGLRCLLVDNSPNPNKAGIRIVESDSSKATDPQSEDTLLLINKQPTRTFFEFAARLQELRGAPIPAGGIVLEGTNPNERVKDEFPPLVQIGDAERVVLVEFQQVSTGETRWRYIPVQPLGVSDMAVPLLWFGCQLGIFAVATLLFRARPFDSAAVLFFAMSVVALGAFIGGFHWWIIAADPWLNVPFIACAGLLPAVTLHFFLVFPQRARPFAKWPRAVLTGLYVPPTLFVAALVALYLQAIHYTQTSTSEGNVEQARVVVEWMDPVIRTYIAIAGVYFILTVSSLIVGFLRTRNPIERSQVKWILWAALLSTVFVGYTLSLAFHDPAGLALGKAEWPMFAASLLFMLAYAIGMVRHKLMLVNEVVTRGALYLMVSSGVTVCFATFIALGLVLAGSLTTPLTFLQQTAVVVILMLAVMLIIWLRDRIQQMLDQRFFREKYRLDQAFQRMNKSMRQLLEPESLADQLLRTNRDVLGVERSALYIRVTNDAPLRLSAVIDADEIPVELSIDDLEDTLREAGCVQRVPSTNRSSMSAVQRLLHDLHAELIYPLETEDELTGLTVLGPKRNGAPFTAEDLTFLHAVGQMTTVALHGARMNFDVARLKDDLHHKLERISDQTRQIALLQAELQSLQPQHQIQTQSPEVADLNRGAIRGSSPAITSVLETIRKVAVTKSTVLIRGESGTGKELLAEVVHNNSPRVDGPFVCVHCAALSSTLLESELFGHVKGAFTGADRDKIGRFAAADGGTLFLDEIGDISLETQIKLLRVLQEQRFEPVGSSQTIHVDVRVVTATHQDLEQLIADGRFREDLYYRLNVISVTLPPLRDRAEDLIELSMHFLRQAAQHSGKTVSRIENDALSALESCNWPGNIRQLQNVIERAVVFAEGDSITRADLPADVLSADRGPKRAVEPTHSVPLSTQGPELRDAWQRILSERAPRHQRQQAERKVLAQALEQTDGNKAQAARMLGIPRSTFFSKVKKLNLD